jgi:uncharacterized protein YndB with AHSA1/START domain
MGNIHAAATSVIDAPPERVYAVLADYHRHHPNILPKLYFTGLRVEEGGVGAGTVVVADMDVYGSKRSFRLAVTEPEPGRVLAESDASAGIFTTFTVEPWAGGAKSRVTIASEAQASPGFAGWIEQLVNPLITARIYRAELGQLNAYMGQQGEQNSSVE